MKGKWFTAGLLATLGVFAWAVPSRAGDTIRLNRVDDTPTQTLVDDGRGADTVQTWYRGFGGFRSFGGFGVRGFGFGGVRGFGFGGVRGFGFGGFPRFGWGFPGWGWGGFRGFGWGWGGFPRWGWGGWGGLGWGGLGWGFPAVYQPFGLGYGLGGFGYGGFYPGIGYGGFYGPCSGLSGSVYTLSMPANGGMVAPATATFQPRYIDYYAPRQAPSGDGTYPYDGGPNNPIPNPKAAPAPQSAPQRSVPLEGRAVSLPKPASKWAYPAYGEAPRRTTFAEDQTLLTKSESKRSGSR